MKTFIIIAYDISSNKKRKKVADLLQKHGTRANKSVFECFLTKKELEKIKIKTNKIINKNEDVVLFYPLCKNCILNSFSIGNHFVEYNKIDII